MKPRTGQASPLARALAAGVGGALLAAVGCATPPSDPVERAAYDEANDPFEPFNRFMFDVNLAIDKNFLRPIAKAYRDVTPEPIRDGIQNFLRNARAPLILINNVLQGEPVRASKTLQRFALNSAFGFGGIVDVAKLAVGLEFHDEDFGQTLGVWGAGEGFYLFLPLIGPSSARDIGGTVVDGVMDPTSLALEHYGITYGPFARSVLTGLDLRSRAIDTLDDVERTSIDFYASLRSLYRQRRIDQIRNGRPEPDRLYPTVAGAAASESPMEEAASLQNGGSMPRPTIVPDSPASAATRGPAGVPAPAPGPVQTAALPAPVALPAASPLPAPRTPPSAATQGVAPAALPARPPGCAAGARWLGADQPVGLIVFKNGSAALAPNDRALLRQIADRARQTGATIRVIGHADENTGTGDPVSRQLVNFDFSWLRADTAAAELQRAGVPDRRVVVEARSDQEPLCPGAPPGDALNRRVNLYLSHGPASES